MNISSSIQAADVSLCVLSLPDVLVQTPQGPKISIPDFLSGFVTRATFFLLNKVDLVPAGLSAANLMRERSAWTVSLLTSEGTAEFLAGFANALREKYVLLNIDAFVMMDQNWITGYF
jgi:tRNA modification GTPase